jgi:hypothetical protein
VAVLRLLAFLGIVGWCSQATHAPVAALFSFSRNDGGVTCLPDGEPLDETGVSHSEVDPPLVRCIPVAGTKTKRPPGDLPGSRSVP